MHALPLPSLGGICTRLPIRIASYWPTGRPDQDHIVYVSVGEPGEGGGFRSQKKHVFKNGEREVWEEKEEEEKGGQPLRSVSVSGALVLCGSWASTRRAEWTSFLGVNRGCASDMGWMREKE